MAFDLSAIGSQFLVGLSRSMILFIVTAGLSFVLGVLRVPNIAHGSLYMIGAFSAFSITKLVPGAEVSGSLSCWLPWWSLRSVSLQKEPFSAISTREST